MAKSGLWVGGEAIGRTPAQFLSVLKYAVVPKSAWTKPVFKSDNMGQIMALADPLAVEIVGAMINDYLAHEFASPPDLAENIALRKGVIDAMKAICDGDVDADYTEAVVGVPPTLGYLENLEVLWSPGAAVGKGVLTGSLPYAVLDPAWERFPSNSPWGDPMFFQKPERALSLALGNIHPFRGECAGAFQLAVLLGCYASLGAEKTDALQASFGPAYIGVWRMPDATTGEAVFTTASRFLTKLHDVRKDYKRGSVIAVPGDYIYFQNKDDYSTLSRTGGWRGENCVYMGQDALGTPHYSGMGLSWKSEFALRMFLSNAYFTDCNAEYLVERRANQSPNQPPVIVEDPQSQVRFTARAVMRYPDATAGPAPDIQAPTLTQVLSDAEISMRMERLGMRMTNAKGYVVEDQPLGQILNIFQIPQSALRQPVKSAMSSPNLEATFGGWKMTFQPRVQGIVQLTLDDIVDVIAYKAAPQA
jgi:hypothetical protein